MSSDDRGAASYSAFSPAGIPDGASAETPSGAATSEAISAPPDALGPVRTFIEAITDALAEEMAADEAVFLLGEDIGPYGGAFKATEGLIERFGPGRVVETPISESAIIGAAIGAAVMGMRPVAEMQYIDFITCGFDQLVTEAAKHRYRTGVPVPMVVRGPSGGGVRGGPFHSAQPEALFAHTPGLKVVMPSSPSDAKGLLKAAIRDDDPVVFLEHKALYRRLKEAIPQGDHLVPLGSAAVRRPGSHCVCVTYGAQVPTALEAAEVLAQDGIQLEVLDLRTLAPLDRETILESVGRCSRVVICHEANPVCGIGAEVAAVIAESGFDLLDAPVRRVTAPQTPVPAAPALEDAYIPQVSAVVAAVRELVVW